MLFAVPVVQKEAQCSQQSRAADRCVLLWLHPEAHQFGRALIVLPYARCALLRYFRARAMMLVCLEDISVSRAVRAAVCCSVIGSDLAFLTTAPVRSI